MTVNETNKRTDKTPLGTLLSVLTSFDVLARYLEVEFRKHNATFIRFHVMSTLFKNGGEMTPSEIAESVFREKNTITAVIKNLENEGVVRRVPSPDDGRSVKVVITDEGWKTANRLNPIAQEISREALAGIGKEEIETLVETMRKLREELMPRIPRAHGNGKHLEQ